MWYFLNKWVSYNGTNDVNSGLCVYFLNKTLKSKENGCHWLEQSLLAEEV